MWLTLTGYPNPNYWQRHIHLGVAILEDLIIFFNFFLAFTSVWQFWKIWLFFFIFFWHLPRCGNSGRSRCWKSIKKVSIYICSRRPPREGGAAYIIYYCICAYYIHALYIHTHSTYTHTRLYTYTAVYVPTYTYTLHTHTLAYIHILL